MFNQSKLLTAAMALGLCVGAANTADAAIVIDFTNASGTFAGSVGATPPNVPKYTVGSLADGTPSESDPGGMLGRAEVSGTLNGADNSESFGFFYDTFTSSSLAGNVLTLNNVGASLMASNASGVASADGDINAAGRGIYFEFDLSSLAPNTGLRITDFTATSTGGAGHNAQIVVDGFSVTTLGGLTGTGLSIDIVDGDLVAFRNVDGTSSNSASDRFRVTSITLESFVVPEPSSLALMGLGGLLIARRRRG